MKEKWEALEEEEEEEKEEEDEDADDEEKGTSEAKGGSKAAREAKRVPFILPLASSTALSSSSPETTLTSSSLPTLVD